MVKVDNWFDHKWLKFSGKVLGALGTWNSELTVPPFVPNRIVWERKFAVADEAETMAWPDLHVSAQASDAAKRKVSTVAPGAAILWFSGATKANARGALMAYVPTSDGYWTWYAGWQKGHSWSTATLKGISCAELAGLSKSVDA